MNSNTRNKAQNQEIICITLLAAAINTTERTISCGWQAGRQFEATSVQREVV